MAQAAVTAPSSQRKMIFTSKVDTIKATILTFVAFLFTGFQCVIYGMLTVPVARHFGIDPSMIVFYDSFGLWGQIVAMATGGIIISRIKGKNTLLVAAIFMICGSVFAILAPNIYIYIAMAFLSNMAVGLVLVSCYYMIMGTVTEEGKSEGTLSILNVFFSIGMMISPIICGFIIGNISWKAVFITIAALYSLFIVFLLLLNVGELIDDSKKEKEKAKDKKFLTLPLILTAIAFFLFVYVEQIMGYFNQPHIQLDLKFRIEIVGTMVSIYMFSQMIGRAVFGKFLLPRVKTHKYIITSAIAFAIFLLLYLNCSSVVMVVVFMALLGLADSCIYPSILGYGLDQIGKVTPAATSFMITIGSIGIPFGTAGCGLIGRYFDRYTAMTVGPILLIIVVILILTVHKLSAKKHTEIKQ